MPKIVRKSQRNIKNKKMGPGNPAWEETKGFWLTPNGFA